MPPVLPPGWTGTIVLPPARCSEPLTPDFRSDFDRYLPAFRVAWKASRGYLLDPWQEDLLRRIGELRPDGRLRYRQCLVSDVELRTRVANRGPVGALLYGAIQQVRDRVEAASDGAFGETYALGDSPLVLLTALQSYFQPDPSSSDYALRHCPVLDDHGEFTGATGGRPIRVYTRLDTRLMFEDLFLKLDEFAAWLGSK